jgi:hypothetical protein
LPFALSVRLWRRRIRAPNERLASIFGIINRLRATYRYVRLSTDLAI